MRDAGEGGGDKGGVDSGPYMMTYMIDDPSPFAPLEEWLEFEASIQQLPQHLLEVRWALDQVARRKAAEPEIRRLLERSAAPGSSRRD